MAKIVLISDRNVYMRRICNLLVENDHEVWLVCRFRNGIPQQEFSDKIHFIDFSSERLSAKWRELRHIIRTVNPDFVHLHYLARDIILPALIFRRRFSYFVTVWGSDMNVASRDPVNRILQNIGLMGADKIHLLSGYFAGRIQSGYYFINKRKITVFSWGIDLKKIREVTPESMQKVKEKYSLHDRKIILSFRNHRPLYNHHTLIRTIPFIVQRFSSVKYVFVCGNSDRDYLGQSRKMVAGSGGTGHVLFIEDWLSVEELAVLIKMSAVSVNIPLSDGLPASLLEVMATGSIPVAGDLPAYREFYKENVNGLVLHSLTDSDELQVLLEKALSDTENLSGEFAKKNNEYIEQHQNWELQSGKLLDLYRKK